jgi:hypothetical protein
MNDLKFYTTITLIAVFGAIVTIFLPAYAQQEVDPAWYDPWAIANTVVVHSPQPQEATIRHQPRVTSVSPSQPAAKSNNKRARNKLRLDALKKR